MSTGLTWISRDGSVWPLDGTQSVEATSGVLGLGAPPQELVLEQRVLAGAALLRRRTPARRLAIPLLIEDAIPDRVLDQLVDAFAVGGELVHVSPTATRTLRSVEYEGGFDGDASPEQRNDSGPVLWRRVVVSLLAMDPWWYGPARSETIDVSANVTAFDAAVAFDADLPFDGGASITLPVAGHVPTPATVTITGPAATVSVASNLASLRISNALGPADVLKIDPVDGPSLNGGPIDWNLLSDTSQPITLNPKSRAVTIGASGSDPSTLVTIEWRDLWRTP